MREADFKGAAEAWAIPVDKSHPNWLPAYEGTLVSYLVHAKWAHPFWSWWMVSGVHLRPIEGVQPVKKHYAEAEYEILILSVDPTCGGKNPKGDYEPDPDKVLDDGVPYMVPPDLIYQFHGVNDAEAKQIVTLCVQTIVRGIASPDQDFRSWWRSTLDTTVAHYRTGKHRVQ